MIALRSKIACICTVAGIACAADKTAASITFTRWDLACVVVPASGNPRGVIISNVTSPFVGSHTVTWQGATNSASYDISFDSRQLDFRADVSVTAPGITGGGIFTSGCTGNVQFTTDTDVLLSVDSHMQYHLPPGDRSAVYNIIVGAIGGPGYVSDGFASSPVFGDPPSGEYSVQAQDIRLPAGAAYSMNYEYTLRSFSGSPTLLSTNGGHAVFTIRPVPEPATALLLLAGITAVARRRRAQAS